jgi:1-acyl-sn-glycerol-3-phosphate acyltransferase
MSPGEYMFWTGLVYFVVDRFVEPEYIQMVWVLVLMIPVLFPIRWLVRGTPFWRVK